MRYLEIRLQDGRKLLIGRPGSFDSLLLQITDQREAVATIRTLSRDQGAMVQLRKGWRKISPSQSASVTGHTDMVKLLQREIGATRLAAVLAPKGDQEMPEVEVPQTQSPVIYIRLDGMTLLVAPPAHLPMQYIGYRDAAAAAGILRTMPVGHPAAAQIDLQAGRLPPGAKAAATGVALRQHLAWMLERRVLDAVILRDTGQIGAVMLQSDAPRAVSQMSEKEKILIAMERCVPLLESGVKALVGELTKQENIAKFIAMLLLFGAVQFVPGAGLLLDAWIIAELIIAIGENGAKAAVNLARATKAAMDAGTDADLNGAAILYKEGFQALGITGLSWLLARMQIKVTTAKVEGGTPFGSMASNAGSKGSKRNQRSDSAQANAKSSENLSNAPDVKPTINSRTRRLAAAADREKITALVKAGKIDEARAVLKPFLDKKDIAGLVDRLDVSVPRNSGFLWSGDKRAAMAYAKKHGGFILEGTPGGKVIDEWAYLQNKFPFKSGGEDIWGAVSSKYSKGLSGRVVAIQTPDKMGGGYFFKTYEVQNIENSLISGKVSSFEEILIFPLEAMR